MFRHGLAYGYKEAQKGQKNGQCFFVILCFVVARLNQCLSLRPFANSAVKMEWVFYSRNRSVACQIKCVTFRVRSLMVRQP